MTGIKTPNLTEASTLDKVIGHQILDGLERTRQQSMANFAVQVSAQSPFSALIGAASDGMKGYATVALLNANLAPDDGTLARVYADADPQANGVYKKNGATGAGDWTFLPELAERYIVLDNAGAGTGNAIVVTSSMAIPTAAYGAIFVLPIVEANGVGGVTVAINGAAAVPLVTNTNAAIPDAYLLAGMAVLCADDGTSLRLMSYGDASAVQAAAEAAQAAAEAAAASVEGLIFNNKATASAYSPATAPEFLSLAGYSSAGDGGAGLYKKVVSEPAHAGKFSITLADTVTVVWYELTSALPVPATALGGFTGTALADAEDYAFRNGGGEIYMPSGSVSTVPSTVTMRTGVTLRGGKGSSLQPAAAMTSLLKLTAGFTAVRGIKIENASAFASYGIEVEKSADNSQVFIEDNYLASFSDAVRWTDGDCLHFNRNYCNSNGFGVKVINDCRNSRFTQNYILGGSGYLFDRTTQGCEGVAISQDVILPAVAGAYCLAMNTALEVSITGCIFDQLIDTFVCSFDATSHTINNVKMVGNWFGRQAGAAGADYGVFVTAGCRSVLSSMNTYVGFQETALKFLGTSGAHGQDDASINDAFLHVDPSLRDIEADYQDNLLIDGATFSGTGASIAENTGVTGRVINCDYGNSVLPSITGGLRYGDQRGGMTLFNSGTGTLVAGGASLVVNHGLSYTPAAENIFVGYQGTPSATFPGASVNTIGASTFNIQPFVPPGGSGTGISWRADLRR